MNMVDSLKRVLADHYALYLKCQNYHWNVEGPEFKELHAFFEDLYKELGQAIDEVAETIRSLNVKAPGTFDFFQQWSTIKSADEDFSPLQMLKDLLHDQSIMEHCLKQALENAQQEKDEVVQDILIRRLSVHRKTKWMLKSLTHI